MRLLKKVVAVGMASTMVFSMAGCGSKTAETPTTAAPAETTTAAAAGETTAAPAETKAADAKVENKDKKLQRLPDRKSTRLNSSHITRSRMPSSA